MAHNFKLSAFGLRLIKAYEGFRSVETTLVSGQHIIGYGHRYSLDEEPVVTKKKAEELLKADLEPYEELVNSNVYAPLTQSQFDALVSLAFNIGPQAFLSSHVLNSLNNGRPLDAAAGFDEWRKSRINDQVYVVDALVRRRTAEKALFLKLGDGVVATPRHELPVQSDLDDPRRTTSEPVYHEQAQSGLVPHAPITQDNTAQQDKDDNKDENSVFSAHLDTQNNSLFQTDEKSSQTPVEYNGLRLVDTPDSPPDTQTDMETPASPIALAAAEVRERLDNLITNPQDENISDEVQDNVSTHDELDKSTVDNAVIQDTQALPHHVDEFIGTHPNTEMQTDTNVFEPTNSEEAVVTHSLGYWAALALGLALIAFSTWKWFFVPRYELSDVMEFIVPVSMMIGAMITLGSFYYVLKSWIRRSS